MRSSFADHLPSATALSWTATSQEAGVGLFTYPEGIGRETNVPDTSHVRLKRASALNLFDPHNLKIK